MGQISHPTLGSPHALVTSQGELLVTGSKSFDNGDYLGQVQLYNTITNGSPVGPANIDDSTFSLISVPYEHHEIHDGNSYWLAGSGNLGIDGELRLGIITPNTSEWMHGLWDLNSKGECIAELWEGTSFSGGFLLTPNNRNRNSPSTPNSILYANPVVSGTTAATASGTRIDYVHLGAKSSSTGTERSQREVIYKSGTTYMLILRSEVNANHVSTRFEWYEHTDKIQQF